MLPCLPFQNFLQISWTDFDAIAFGCPSMGSEQLEQSELEPIFAGCESKLNGQGNCTVWFLRMGRRRVDERLGRQMY